VFLLIFHRSYTIDVIEGYNRNDQEGIQMKQKNQIGKIIEGSDEYDNPVIVLAEYI
jgi:hypothetical protein